MKAMQDAAVGTVRKKISMRKRMTRRVVLIFLLPMLIYYTIFTVLPIVSVFFLSFVRWRGIEFSQIQWVGFQWYKLIFTSNEYYPLILNAMLMGGIILVISLVAGFFLAQMLVAKIPCSKLFRTMWYLPVVLSMAVVSQLVLALISSDGVINTIIVNNGGNPIAFKDSVFWMYFFIIVLCVWKGLGTTIIMFMAGLQAIPNELYEAAKIDGVNAWQKLIYITLPLIRNMFAFIMITSVINAFVIFEPVQLISGGGPDGATKVIMYQIYDSAFLNFNLGLSAALSVVVLIICGLLTALNMRIAKTGD